MSSVIVTRPVRTDDDRLAYLDQASFLALRATGLGQLAQWVWVYQRDVNLDELRRFHRELGYGLLGRRIERSPLPFGRHRWVAEPRTSPLHVATDVRPRAELGDWVDWRAQLPIDPERGPGWHLAVQRFDDGATALTLVASHCLVDGLGGGLAIAAAVRGERRGPGHPPAGSRAGWDAVSADVRRTLRDAPDVVGAVTSMVRQARDGQQDLSRVGGSKPIAVDGRGTVVVPTIMITIPAGHWDARVGALGGTSNALVTAIAARTGARMGRLRPDGRVNVRFVVSDRTEGDTRANAVSFVTIDVDPGDVTRDLTEVRARVKRSLAELGGAPDPSLEVLPVTPFAPKWAVRRMADALFDDFSVGCSYLGDVDPATVRPDGTEADAFHARGVTQRITAEVLERIRGQVTLAAGRFADKVFVTVVGYRVGGDNTKPALRALMADTLSEFGLRCDID